MSIDLDEKPVPDGLPFGAYRLLSLLGVGGMAKVYRGVRSGPAGFEKPVAVKLLDRHITADHKCLKALINEARLGARIHHPNVVEIYEFGEHAGTWFMAMELVDGWPLSTVLRRCKLLHKDVPRRAVVDLLVGICEGLDHAHRLRDSDGTPLRIVHRDLKPGNIALTRRGDVKVLDFGVARAESNLFKTTLAGAAKGTPHYMSPEQLEGQPLTHRSDLFSLGSVLHEILTLERPFPGAGVGDVALAMVEGRTETVTGRIATVFPELGQLSRRLMERDPERRPPSAGHVRAMLVELREELPEGPGLSSWLQELTPKLPALRAPGDFGEHPPQVAGNTSVYASKELVDAARHAEGTPPARQSPEQLRAPARAEPSEQPRVSGPASAEPETVVPAPTIVPASAIDAPARKVRSGPPRRRRKRKKPARPGWVIPALLVSMLAFFASLVALVLALT